MNKEDHDGSLINNNTEFPKLDVNTNNIGASDTSSNLEVLENSKCNILLMGSSAIQASALPKNTRIESQIRKRSSCNVVNIGSVGESLEGSLLKYLTIKELEQFQFVYLMLGGIDAYLADNPNQRKQITSDQKVKIMSIYKDLQAIPDPNQRVSLITIKTIIYQKLDLPRELNNLGKSKQNLMTHMISGSN